jgi:hypothetical protein
MALPIKEKSDFVMILNSHHIVLYLSMLVTLTLIFCCVHLISCFENVSDLPPFKIQLSPEILLKVLTKLCSRREYVFAESCSLGTHEFSLY